MRVFRIVMALLVLATGAPLIARLGAGLIARSTGCTLDMAAAKPCIVGGVDVSSALGVHVSVSGFLFATLPLLLAARPRLGPDRARPPLRQPPPVSPRVSVMLRLSVELSNSR